MDRARGFTLIELLVVMAIIATLLSLVGPRYFASLDRSKEVVLKTNLRIVRDAIDKYHGDTGRYPPTLEELVARRYLRDMPVDPITERTDTWIVIAPGESPSAQSHRSDRRPQVVYDVRSGAAGTGLDDTPYLTW